MSSLSEPCFYKRLHQLVRLYSLKQFIETGLGPECDGLRTARALRLTLMSCDVNMTFVERARAMFGPEEKEGVGVFSPLHSLDFLRWVLPEFAGEKRTLFFLDAHFPEYPDYENPPESIEGTPKFPLLDELKIIRDLKAGVEHDVILCDDMRCIEDLENPRWDPKEMENSQIVQRGTKFKEYTDIFKATHEWQVFPEFEGVLCFTPRGEK